MRTTAVYYIFIGIFLFNVTYVKGADVALDNNVPAVEQPVPVDQAVDNAIEHNDHMPEAEQAAPEGQGGGWSLWPSDIVNGTVSIAAGYAGKFAGEAAEHAGNSGVDKLAEKKVALLKESAKDVIDHTKATMDITLQEGGPLDLAADRACGHAERHLDRSVARAKIELEQAGHILIVDLTQNVAKALLTSTMGGFGAVLAYKNLMEYVQEQTQAHSVHTQQSALFVQKLEEGGLIKKDSESKFRLYLAAAGATSFTTACILCCYWIR